MCELNAREAEILETLATDAQALKVENGWYGDPNQGNSTRQEDETAIQSLGRLKRLLHTREVKALEVELTNTGDEFMILVQEMMSKEGKLTMAVCKRATDFFGFCQDGDMDQVRKAYAEMKEYVEERRADAGRTK